MLVFVLVSPILQIKIKYFSHSLIRRNLWVSHLPLPANPNLEHFGKWGFNCLDYLKYFFSFFEALPYSSQLGYRAKDPYKVSF